VRDNPAKGDRVSWLYQGKRTYGEVVSVKGAGRHVVRGPTGGEVVRVGTETNEIIRIKSEATGNAVLKPRSELSKAAKTGKATKRK
jgi:hypothetical protein